MDNRLVLGIKTKTKNINNVIILVVMDNGLVPAIAVLFLSSTGLNPRCSGQYFHTRPYKTILIINKLKSSIKQTFTFLDRKRTIS